MLWISANSRLVSWACTRGIGTAQEIAGICAIFSWEWLILVPWRAFCRRTFSAWFLGNIKLQIFTFFFFFFFLSQNACFLLSQILQFLEEIQGLNSIYLKLSCESPVSATCTAKSVILLMELLCWLETSPRLVELLRNSKAGHKSLSRKDAANKLVGGWENSFII